MGPRQLVAREHENLITTLSSVAANAEGSLVGIDAGIAMFSAPLPIHLFNQVLIAADDADPPALDRAVEAMRRRQATFVVNLRDGVDDGWVPRVRDLGLVENGPEPWMPGMAAHPLPPPGSVPVPDGHEIRLATDLVGLRDHVTAASAGFETPPEWFEALMSAAVLDDPAFSLYVGYTDGVPVTSGAGYRTGDTIGIYNVATVESARRRGYGAAMTMRIVDDGLAAGCDLAVLQASDVGYSVYERLGFRTVVRYRAWVEPEPVA